jgi:hypothetical protein
VFRHEEASSAKTEPTSYIQESSSKPEDPEEGFQPSNLPPFEDDLFKDFKNTSNYLCQRKPPVPATPLDPLDKDVLRESIKELTAIMSSEWVEEAEQSSEEIQIHIPFSTIHCKIHGIMVEVLYNPTHSLCIHFNNEPLPPINKSCKITPRSRLEGSGILHDISLYHEQIEILLDFHVIDIKNFDVMIWHPLEHLFIEPPSLGELNVKLRRDMFSIPITQAKNSVANTLP